jgi:hypothetical protein
MLRQVEQNPGPLKNLAVKTDGTTYYWLSEKTILFFAVNRLDEFLWRTEDRNPIIDFKPANRMKTKIH